MRQKQTQSLLKKLLHFSIFLSFFHLFIIFIQHTISINICFPDKTQILCNTVSNKIILLLFDVYHFYFRLLDIPDTVRCNVDIHHNNVFSSFSLILKNNVCCYCILGGNVIFISYFNDKLIFLF